MSLAWGFTTVIVWKFVFAFVLQLVKMFASLAAAACTAAIMTGAAAADLGVKPYTTAVASLFDPTVSKADLLSSEVSGPDNITLRWRLEGRLKLGVYLFVLML